MLKKIWNGKASGVFAALVMLSGIIIDRALNYIATYMYRGVLGGCGKNVKIFRGFKCRYPGTIQIGSNVLIDKQCTILSETTSSFVVKDGVSIGIGCIIDFTGGVIIEEQTHLAAGVRIITHDHGYDYKSRPLGKSLIIGKNVFIGYNSVIMPNVSKIGDNAVIGVGSVVTKEVQPNAIIAGTPGKVIKYRNA